MLIIHRKIKYPTNPKIRAIEYDLITFTVRAS